MVSVGGLFTEYSGMADTVCVYCRNAKRVIILSLSARGACALRVPEMSGKISPTSAQ